MGCLPYSNNSPLRIQQSRQQILNRHPRRGGFFIFPIHYRPRIPVNPRVCFQRNPGWKLLPSVQILARRMLRYKNPSGAAAGTTAPLRFF